MGGCDHIYIYVCVCVYTTYTYLCMYVCMYVCMCVYIDTHIYIYNVTSICHKAFPMLASRSRVAASPSQSSTQPRGVRESAVHLEIIFRAG